jgi:hypothetical protein
MGTNTGNVAVDYEYPLAFQETFTGILEKLPGRPKFRFVLLSGKFVTRDQDKSLWFLDMPRKLKVRLNNPSIPINTSRGRKV